jgi:inhibitor of cysteine peptidase
MASYYKGYVRRPDKDHLILLSHRKHQAHLKQLQAVPQPPQWDSRTHNLVGPVKDQAACGSCWDFSGTGIIEIAFNKAGIGGGPSTFILSEEYTLSCYRNGGCNGDDNTTVLDWAKSHGLPLTKDYGGYTASVAKCHYKPSMQLYKLDDWGFADANGGSGVTPTNDIKAAIMQYGAVGCAIAADDAFMNHPAGSVFAGSGSKNIDHDVILVGWDNTTNSWILRNSWGSGWCENGYVRIAYGANLVGTESVWSVKFAGATA